VELVGWGLVLAVLILVLPGLEQVVQVLRWTAEAQVDRVVAVVLDSEVALAVVDRKAEAIKSL
jgi:hypothetical protein